MYTLKYRRLSLEELATFEKEFIQFLVINGFDVTEWIKLKSNNQERTDELINEFSDTILEGILQKTTYYDYILPNVRACYKITDDEAFCYILTVTEKANLDLTLLNNIKQINNLAVEDFNLIFAQKKLDMSRNSFLFDELNRGCQITNGELFEVFESLHKTKN